MRYLSRPWGNEFKDETADFTPNDCLLGEFQDQSKIEHVVLQAGEIRGQQKGLALFPYPKGSEGSNPRRNGFPIRPRQGHEPTNESEVHGAQVQQQMHAVLARVQELEEALSDPSQTWVRLREAWKRAEDEADPRMAEIVRQARLIKPILLDLEKRLRRVLRRIREMTPLDRVQEMDRASMVWLSKQPGTSIAERAGSSQRILATARKENFDTLENRVLHAYARLASETVREWQREQHRGRQSKRYKQVEAFGKLCRRFATALRDMGITVAEAGVTPNYVLQQDRSYRQIHENWLRLLQRRKIEDDLWAWQAETWTDFSVLAIILAIEELKDCQLVAQSPILWSPEVSYGRWFEMDRPIAVFWLQKSNQTVEVRSRPVKPGTALTLARAHVSLRISNVDQTLDTSRLVAVWTPHAFNRLDLEESTKGAASRISDIQRIAPAERLTQGLIVTPAWESFGIHESQLGTASVTAVAIDPSGDALSKGFEAIRQFIRTEVGGMH